MTLYKKAEKRRDKKNNRKRKGSPTFSAVRFNDTDNFTSGEKKRFVENTVMRHGGTREAALLDAFTLLKHQLTSLD